MGGYTGRWLYAMRRLRKSGTANSSAPPRNSPAGVPQRVMSTSVYSSWSIHRYLVHTSEAMTSRTTSTARAPIVIASGEILRGPLELASGAGRGRGRGMSPNGAEKLTYNIGCFWLGDCGSADRFGGGGHG